MDYEETLPFGKTQITSETYRSQIEFHKAIRLLKKKEVRNSEVKLNSFIQDVPQMLGWLENNGKVFPWRQTTDDWEVFTAEVLLQRTPGEQVEGIYEDFLHRFPDPKSLKKAEKRELKDVITGLGFVNRRTKILGSTGEIFSEDYGNRVPELKRDIKDPWGVGNYVANATLLFARGESIELVDPNVKRHFEKNFELGLDKRPHKSQYFRELTSALTPKNPEIARSFFLSMIDLDADKNL